MRRFNPSQKRGYHGRWVRGSGAGAATKVVTGGQSKQYAAFQASQKSAARKARIKKVAVGAAVLGVAGAGVYAASRKGSAHGGVVRHVPTQPLHTQGPKVPVAGRATHATPISLVRASVPKRSSPAQLKVLQGGKMPSKPAMPSKSTAKPNGVHNPVANPAVHAGSVSTVAAMKSVQKVSLTRQKPKNKAGVQNPSPTPGAMLTEDGKKVVVVRGLQDARRIELERRAVKANRSLAEMEKKAGVNVGAKERAKFEAEYKRNIADKQAKRDAVTAASDAKRIARRENFSATVAAQIGAQAIIGSRADRVEERYLSLLQKHVDSGKRLPPKQRKILSGDVPLERRKQRRVIQNNISGAKYLAGQQQKARVERAKAKRHG